MGVGEKQKKTRGRKCRKKMKIGKARNGDEGNKEKNMREEKKEIEIDRRDTVEYNQKYLSY